MENAFDWFDQLKVTGDALLIDPRQRSAAESPGDATAIDDGEPLASTSDAMTVLKAETLGFGRSILESIGREAKDIDVAEVEERGRYLVPENLIREVRSDGAMRISLTNRLIVFGERHDPRKWEALPGMLGAETEGDGWVIYDFDSAESYSGAVERFRSDADTDYIEPEFLFWEAEDLRGAEVYPGGLEVEILESRQNFDPGLVFRAIGLTDESRCLAALESNVAIALMDGGVSRDHGLLKQSYREYHDTARRWWTDPPQRLHTAHGTCCAGLAVGQNPAAGVARGVALLDVQCWQKIGGVDNVSATTHVARALSWVQKRSEDVVVSISLRVGAYSYLVQSELEKLATQGRDGLGVPIFAAAGNTGGPVEFPARAGPYVFTVGGCDLEGRRIDKHYGESWASAVGPELDLLAPAVDNPTTDRLYGEEGEPMTGFSKTSSATPLVAGAAALMLCANRSLGRAEVYEILRDNASKHSDMGGRVRTDEYGYGVLQVDACVRAAQGARFHS